MAQWSGFLRGVLESQRLLQSEVNLEMTWGHSGQELLRQPQWPEPTLACADPAGKKPREAPVPGPGPGFPPLGAVAGRASRRLSCHISLGVATAQLVRSLG